MLVKIATLSYTMKVVTIWWETYTFSHNDFVRFFSLSNKTMISLESFEKVLSELDLKLFTTSIIFPFRLFIIL